MLNSIPDQFLGRAGLHAVVWPLVGLGASLGVRVEGVPAYDLVGGSYGFRRPGYTVSVEPGLSWVFHHESVSVLVPIAVYRNRLQSAIEAYDGLPAGPTAFADWSLIVGYTHRF